MSRSGRKATMGLAWLCWARMASMRTSVEGKPGVYLAALQRQRARDGRAQVAVRVLGGHPSTRRPAEEPQLEEIWLHDVLDGVGLLPHGGREGREPYRAAAELVDERLEDRVIQPVQAPIVHLEDLQTRRGDLERDRAVVAHLGEVADPS